MIPLACCCKATASSAQSIHASSADFPAAACVKSQRIDPRPPVSSQVWALLPAGRRQSAHNGNTHTARRKQKPGPSRGFFLFNSHTVVCTTYSMEVFKRVRMFFLIGGRGANGLGACQSWLLPCPCSLLLLYLSISSLRKVAFYGWVGLVALLLLDFVFPAAVLRGPLQHTPIIM